MLLAVRESFAAAGGAHRPYDAELAYIEMVKGPYLQLPLIGSRMTYVELYVTPYSTSSRMMVMGGSRANSAGSSSVYFDINGGVWRNTGIAAAADRTDHIIVKRIQGTVRGNVSINGQTVSRANFGPFTMDREHMQIGNSNSSAAASRLNGRLGRMRIEESRSWSLVPCRKDSMILFYDEVSDAFIANAGTGSFVGGPDINT